MNLIILEDSDRLAASRFRVTGARARHIREVLRAEPGRELRVGLLEGPLGTGRVVAAESSTSTSASASEGPIELECEFQGDPSPRPLVDLVLAIPRPKSLAKLLPEVAALGVDRLVLLRTWRVEKPYLTAAILEPAAYRPLLHQGLMQGRSTREPRVLVEPLFKPWVEDRAPAFIAGARALAAHSAAVTDLATMRLRADERVVLAVGPEGGFIAYELEALARAGFQPVTMGARTLRVETACVALLAQLDLLRRLRS